jgi:hypothetical protein
LTNIKVACRNIVEIRATILIGGATIDTLLAVARRAMIKLKMPRGMEVA